MRLAWPAAANDATSPALAVETWREKTVGLSEPAEAGSTASTIAPTGLPLVTVALLASRGGHRDDLHPIPRGQVRWVSTRL